MTPRLRSVCSWLALLISCAACRYAPEGAAPLAVTSAYRQWWSEVEDCAGREAAIERVRFWVIKGDEFPCPNGPCAGHWRSPHDVYIAETWVHNETLVKHEMLHDILGTGDHPASYFAAACQVSWSRIPAGGEG